MDIQTLDINGNPATNHTLLSVSTESKSHARVRKISPISLTSSAASPAQKLPQSPSQKSKKSKTTRKIGKLLRTLTDYQLLATSVDESSSTKDQEDRHSNSFTSPVINMSSATNSPSDIDICGQTNRDRFPWLIDASTQYYDPTMQEQITPKEESMLKSSVKRKPTPAHVRSSSLLSNEERKTGKLEVFRSRTKSLDIDVGDPLESVNGWMTPTSLDQYAHDESLEHDDVSSRDLRRYRLGGRRACIISDLDLGPESERRESNGDRSSPRSLQKSLSRENSMASMNSNSRPSHHGSETSLTESASIVLPPEKSKSLKSSKSFMRILASLKKNGSPETLEFFLKNEMKPSVFIDDRLHSFKQTHWREQIELTDGSQINDVFSDTEIKRLDAVWELFTNECTFLTDHLMVMKHVFMEPMKKCQVEGLLMAVDPYKLFGNLDELCHLSYAFCKDFMSTLTSMKPDEFGSTDSLIHSLDTMTLNSRDGDIYHVYLLNYKAALAYLDYLRNEVEEMGVFEKFCEQDPRCNRLKLTDLLIAPMHHWTRLPLILERVRKHTRDTHDVQRLDDSISKVVASLKALENKMEWQKTKERVKEIENQLVWPTIQELDSKAFIPESLKEELVKSISPDIIADTSDKKREVLYEGQLILTEKEKTFDVYAFLFTDFIIITRMKKDPKKSRYIKNNNVDKSGPDVLYHILRQPIPVQSLSVYEMTPLEASSAGFKHVFVIVQRNLLNQVVQVITFQAHTSLGKEKWISSIRSATDSMLESSLNGLCNRKESYNQLLDERPPLLKNSRVLEIPNTTAPINKHTSLHRVHSYQDTTAGLLGSRSPRVKGTLLPRASSGSALIDTKARTSSLGNVNMSNMGRGHSEDDSQIDEMEELDIIDLDASSETATNIADCSISSANENEDVFE